MLQHKIKSLKKKLGGTGLEAAAKSKRSQGTWGCQAAEGLICQRLCSFQRHCRQRWAQQLRGSPDLEGGGDKRANVHFQGMKSCGRRAAPRAERQRAREKKKFFY